MGMEWVHRAKCKDEDPELFFPIGTTGPAAAQIEAAKAICMKCEVRVHCLEWALATGQDAGVWGGMSEEERRALRRVHRRESAGMRPVVVGT
jgi:WhiB family transcriptional regulator, redox-sensing transcriptional regulator